MTNKESKEKLIGLLKKAMEPIEYGGDPQLGIAPEVHYPTEEEIADVLIDAGIGDVSAYKTKAQLYDFLYSTSQSLERNMAILECRVEVDERALQIAEESGELRAPEILFKRAGLCRHFAESRKAWERIAPDT